MSKKIITVLVFIFLFIALGTVAAYNYLSHRISQDLNVSPSYLYQEIFQALKQPKTTSPYNLIVLGLDERNDTLEVTQTTDTIIFASFNLNTQKLSLVSLPRDLWSYSLGHKINDIYPESLKTNNKYSYIKDEYQKVIGQKIDQVVVISTTALSDLVSIVGGVDVDLTEGFIDHQYPNPEYVKDPKNPKIPIYITVEYKAGTVHLDNQNIIPFVRSRKSLTGGTDLGRIKRQQLVIEALISKMKNYQSLSYSQLTHLYQFWHHNVATDIRDRDLLALILQLRQKLLNINLHKIDIPVGTSPKTGIIFHPTTFINSQWVFVTGDKDFSSLKKYIQEAL